MTREEAKEILTHNWTRVDNPNYSESELDEAVGMAIEALSAEQRTGEWIHDGQNFKGGIDWCHCSECGYMTSANGLSIYRYCKNCGAKMKGADHEVD